jgi:hypothetical protein
MSFLMGEENRWRKAGWPPACQPKRRGSDDVDKADSCGMEVSFLNSSPGILIHVFALRYASISI